jgi:hypothetical protein
MTASGSTIRRLAASACCAVSIAGPAAAEGYCARLGPADHFNSSGGRLKTVGAIVRQDRANFHEFGVRDRGDESDPIFADKVSREQLQRQIDRNEISAADRRAILDGAPYVCVTIDGDLAFISSVR